MKIKYDNTIDAKYVYIKKGNITHTKKEQDWLLFDCDKNGEVLGVEILDASKHLVGISILNNKFVSCSIMELKSEDGSEYLKFEINKLETKRKVTGLVSI